MFIHQLYRLNYILYLEHQNFERHVEFGLAFAAEGGENALSNALAARAENADLVYRQSLAIEHGKIAGCK